LAINKIDRVKAEVLLALAEKMNAAFPFVEPS
jgi:GTPase